MEDVKKFVVFRPDGLEDLSDLQLSLRAAHLEQEAPKYPVKEEKTAAGVALEQCVAVLETRDIAPLDLSVDEGRDARLAKMFGPLIHYNRKKSSK
jgi:hypothetical protein